MFGKTLQASEPDEYREQRAILQPSFRGGLMGGYVGVMTQETLSWLDTLGSEGEFDIRAVFEPLSMYIGASALMGRDFRRHMKNQFWALYRDLAGGMEFVLPPNLPLPRFRRRDRARTKLRAMLRSIIAVRHAHPDNHNDFLQSFLEATYSDGTPVAEDTIVNLILLMVFAAYETT